MTTLTPEQEARKEKKRAKARRRRARIKEAEAMAKIHNRVGTDDPPSAHERMKVEVWKASNPDQLFRFRRMTGQRNRTVSLSINLSPTTAQNLRMAFGAAAEPDEDSDIIREMREFMDAMRSVGVEVEARDA